MPLARWSARILGLLLVGLFLLFAFGAEFHPASLTGTEWAMTTALVLALVGMILLWVWEGFGGAMVIAGMCVFYAINFVSTARFPGGGVFPICFIPGILALISWWDDRYNQMTTNRFPNRRGTHVP